MKNMWFVLHWLLFNIADTRVTSAGSYISQNALVRACFTCFTDCLTTWDLHKLFLCLAYEANGHVFTMVIVSGGVYMSRVCTWYYGGFGLKECVSDFEKLWGQNVQVRDASLWKLSALCYCSCGMQKIVIDCWLSFIYVICMRHVIHCIWFSRTSNLIATCRQTIQIAFLCHAIKVDITKKSFYLPLREPYIIQKKIWYASNVNLLCCTMRKIY